MLAFARRSRAVLVFVFSALLLAADGAAPAKEAHASVSIAVLFESLVADTSTVAIVTPVEQHALWEGGRILTYTRVHLDQGIAGALGTGAETWVVTLGGIVGDIGATVDGEATLRVGQPTLLFLRPDAAAVQAGAAGTHIVTGRAQGQFHVRLDPKTHVRTFQTSPARGALYPPPASMLKSVRITTLAADAIVDRPIDDVAKDIASLWSRTHGK